MHKGQLMSRSHWWWLLLASGILAGVLGVQHWPVPETPDVENTARAQTPTAVGVSRQRTPLPAATATSVEGVLPPGRQRSATDSELAEVARTAGCPWPPRPDTWRDLGGECLESLNRLELDSAWNLALHDPAGDRRAVATAFDDIECHVPLHEADDRRPAPRPDLYEVCAAESMVRLALLQRLCARTAVSIEDLESALDEDLKAIDRMVGRIVARSNSDPQGNFHRLVADNDASNVRRYWKAHMCRSVREEAFDWIEALPLPAIKRGDQPPPQGVTVELDDGSFLHATLPPPLPSDYTQEEALFRAAHRAGADVSRWFTVQ